MSDSTPVSMLKDNWYLLVLLIVIVAAAGFMYSHPSSVPVPAGTRAVAAQASVAGNTATPMNSPAPGSVSHNPLTWEQDQIRDVITGYRKKIAEDPKAETVLGLRLAIANLTMMKLRDYKEAAQQYELILMDYPDNRTAYIQLFACYEGLGDKQNEAGILRKMMEKYPPESQEYQYAKSRLGR